jgi:hypothetical protein
MIQNPLHLCRMQLRVAYFNESGTRQQGESAPLAPNAFFSLTYGSLKLLDISYGQGSHLTEDRLCVRRIRGTL